MLAPPPGACRALALYDFRLLAETRGPLQESRSSCLKADDPNGEAFLKP